MEPLRSLSASCFGSQLPKGLSWDPQSVWCAGSRLTAYELVHDGLPATLVVDSAAAALMAQGRVDAVVVGADRIAANGDTANKIGTYSLAVNAAQHK